METVDLASSDVTEKQEEKPLLISKPQPPIPDPNSSPEEQAKQVWARDMRLKFSPPEMLLSDGRINHEYFAPKQTHINSRKWTDKEKQLLIAGIEKHGIGNWNPIITDGLQEWTALDLRMKTSVLMGRQSLKYYKGWRGDERAIAKEHERNHKIGIEFNAWKGNMLVADDAGKVVERILETQKHYPSPLPPITSSPPPSAAKLRGNTSKRKRGSSVGTRRAGNKKENLTKESDSDDVMEVEAEVPRRQTRSQRVLNLEEGENEGNEGQNGAEEGEEGDEDDVKTGTKGKQKEEEEEEEEEEAEPSRKSQRRDAEDEEEEREGGDGVEGVVDLGDNSDV